MLHFTLESVYQGDVQFPISANNAGWLGEFDLISKSKKINQPKNNCLEVSSVCSFFQLCHKQITASMMDYRRNVIMYAQVQLTKSSHDHYFWARSLRCIVFIRIVHSSNSNVATAFSRYRMNKSSCSFKAMLVKIATCAVLKLLTTAHWSAPL